MKEVDRGESLKQEFNKFWSDIFSIEDDYHSKIPGNKLVNLKQATRNINNLLTYEVTLELAKQICIMLNLSGEEESNIIENIKKVNSNTNGYDIEYSGTKSIIAEVKCNVPINGGKLFGSAQKSALLKDIEALTKGKNKAALKSTTDYYKFLGMYDCGSSIRGAVKKLIEGLSKQGFYNVEIYDNQKLDKDKIYIIFVEIH